MALSPYDLSCWWDVKHKHQWLSGRVLDSRPRGRGFKPHRCHCVVVLEQDTFILAYIVLVQPRKTRLCLTERLLMGHKETNQTNKRTQTHNNTTKSEFLENRLSQLNGKILRQSQKLRQKLLLSAERVNNIRCSLETWPL